MALDFSDYLFHSDDSMECDDDGDSEPNIVSNTGNGCHEDKCACAKQSGNQPKGICKDSGEPSSGYPSSVPKIVKTDDYDDNVREGVSSKRPLAELTRSDEPVTSAQRIRDWKTGSLETLSRNDKIEHPSKKQLSLGGVEATHYSVGDLYKLLERLKMEKTSPELMDPNTARRPIGGHPDDQDPNRMTQRQQQPVYRSRRSLPSRLTDDHVTPAVQETRKKNGRRGSVKFADEFGLNLNTFAMIPSRFSAQAHNDVNRHHHSNNRKWNSDDRMSSTYIDRNTATDGFRGMGYSQWYLSSDLASDLGRFLSNGGDDDKTLWSDCWGNPYEFRSKAKSLDDDDDLQDPSNHRRYSSEKRSLKPERMKQETPEAEVARWEAEAEVNGRRHDFRLRFEQPFADLDGFQRKLRENFLCLENIRVDDRSLKNGNDDHSGTGPSRKRQGTTILCSIKVMHTDGGVGGEGGVTVFSRCTDNEWVTHADLPAQRLSGVSSLGFDYDTFCFAVRKPVQSLRDENEAASSAAGPTSAVEFALCCRVTRDGRTVSHWDNNDGVNYRIEWFDD